MPHRNAFLPLLLSVIAATTLAACRSPAEIAVEDSRQADAHCQAHGTDGFATTPQITCRLARESARKEYRRAGWTSTQAPTRR